MPFMSQPIAHFRRCRRIVVGVAFLLGVTGLTFEAPLLASETRTAKGQYVWNDDSPGAIEATFTPASEGNFAVDFRFRFDGRDRHWRGTAEGSLEAGELRGTVREGRRTFRFSGKVAEGVFRGRHVEVYGDREEDTGSLTLTVSSPGG